METEHIVTTGSNDPAAPATHTTIIREGGESSGGGKGVWVGLLAVILLAVVGFVVFGQMSDAEVAKDNAVADAADQVGNAANQVGDAVEQGVDDLTNK